MSDSSHFFTVAMTRCLALLLSSIVFVSNAVAGIAVGQDAPFGDLATRYIFMSSEQAVLKRQSGNIAGILKVHNQPDPSIWVRSLASAGGAYSARIYGQAILVGGGKEVSPGLTLGVAVGSIASRISASHEKVSTHTRDIYVYGLFNDRKLFINTAIAVGSLKTYTARNLQSSVLVAEGSAPGSFVGIAFKSGYRLSYNRLFLYPFVGAGYLHIHRNAYTETGAGLNDLSFGAANYGIGSFRAGARVGIVQQEAKGLAFSQWVEIGGIAFTGNRRNILKVTLDTVQQVIPDTGAPSTAGTINVGLTAKSSKWAANFVYRGQFSRHTHMNTGELIVLYRW